MIATYDMKEFSKKIKKIRNKYGYTIENVSKATGISKTTLIEIEKGNIIPKYDTIEILSRYYKIELLKMLIQCKNSVVLYEFYNSVNKIMALNDLELLKKCIDEINNKLNNADLKPIDYRDFNQLRLFFLGLDIASQCNIGNYNEIENAISILSEAIKHTNNCFEISNFRKFKYNDLEYKILFSIASLLGMERKCDFSNEILLFIQEYLDVIVIDDYYLKLLYVKTYSILSYNSHRVDDHCNALNYAEKGIILCLSYDSYTYMPLLLARKSIALKNLNHEDYEKFFNQALNLLEIQNRDELISQYTSILQNMDL